MLLGRINLVTKTQAKLMIPYDSYENFKHVIKIGPNRGHVFRRVTENTTTVTTFCQDI